MADTEAVLELLRLPLVLLLMETEAQELPERLLLLLLLWLPETEADSEVVLEPLRLPLALLL